MFTSNDNFGGVLDTIFDTVGKVGTDYIGLQQLKERRRALEAEAKRVRALQVSSSTGISNTSGIAGIPWSIIILTGGIALVGIVVLTKRRRKGK